MKKIWLFTLGLCLMGCCWGGNYGILKGNVYFNEDIDLYFDFPDRFVPDKFLGIPGFLDRESGEMIFALSGKSAKEFDHKKDKSLVLEKNKTINGKPFKDLYYEEDGDKFRMLVCQENGIYFILAHKFGSVRPSNWPHGVEQYSDMVLGIK